MTKLLVEDGVQLLCSDRVCKGWKMLPQPENWPPVLLLDEFPQSKPPLYFESRCIDYFLKSYKKRGEVLGEVFKGFRFLIVDCGRANDESPHFRSLLYCLKIFIAALAGAYTDGGNLEHIIVTGGRLSPYGYSSLAYSLELASLDTAQRPLQFSLINCSMLHSLNASILKNINPIYRLFSENVGEMSVPRWSHQFPAEKDILSRQLWTMLKKALFPYSLTQIVWLENCLRTLIDSENIGDFGGCRLGDLRGFWLASLVYVCPSGLYQ